MVHRVWTADALEAFTPAEQDELFEASLIRDPEKVPPEFWERLRQRTADTETQDR